MRKILILAFIIIECFSNEIVINETQKIDLDKRSTFTRDDLSYTVTDTDKNLMWQDSSTAKSTKKKFKGAIKFCEKLTLAGHADWKLPTISQLESIADYTRFAPGIKKEFKNVVPDFYWSSSTYMNTPELMGKTKEEAQSFSHRQLGEQFYENNAWSVHFRYGYSHNQNRKASKRNLRCVREIKE